MHHIYKNVKICSNPLFIKNQTAERMIPAINFQHGLHYHFKVRFHWPCLSGSLVLRSLNTALKGNIIKHVLGKVKSLAIATTEKLFYPALTHLPPREKQVSFSKRSWAARYIPLMEYLSLPLQTVWPSDHRSKDWSSPDDTRWKHKTSDQYFQEGLKVEHQRGKLCTKGAGGRRKRSRSWPQQRSAAILTHKITTLHAPHKEAKPLQYQCLGYSNIHAASKISISNNSSMFSPKS